MPVAASSMNCLIVVTWSVSIRFAELVEMFSGALKFCAICGTYMVFRFINAASARSCWRVLMATM